jgi:tRNA nucleotidyltransferase/poly(A) polymerase
MPASPKEDAERRDLTINSLFYNINTQSIEDYIGGVKDLEQKLIRTPLDPEKTLCDDPLRMLRALRFLSRFKFTLDGGIKRVMAGQKFKTAFKDKAIKKEVISKEIEGFFKDSIDPLLAFNEIYDNGLWNEIFGGEGKWGKDSIAILQNLKLPPTIKVQSASAVEVQPASAVEDDKKPKINVPMLTVLSALTLPLATKDKIQPPAKKAKTCVEIFYGDQLKLGKKLFEKSNIIHKCIFSILDIKLWQRSTIGMIMYDAAECFNIALNIINAYDEKLYTILINFIKDKKLELENVTKVVDSIKGDILKSKIEPSKIRDTLQHMRIYALDNPDINDMQLLLKAFGINP